MWTIPADKMKRTVHGKANGRPHFVPLAPQAVEVLRELKPLTGHGHYVFPSLLTGERPMSENTVRAALRRKGYANEEMTAHGFRAMARTLIVERLPGIAPDVIEAQLAHGKSGPLGTAYDRAEFMEQRSIAARSRVSQAQYKASNRCCSCCGSCSTRSSASSMATSGALSNARRRSPAVSSACRGFRSTAARDST